MLSFYQKLESKLNEVNPDAVPAAPAPSATSRTASFKATGERVDQSQRPGTPPVSIAVDPADNVPPDGMEPLDIDLFQSDARMVIVAQLPGVARDGLEIVMSEEENTLTIQAEQKRPAPPPLSEAKDGDRDEKGRYVKQETKWKRWYRKVYLPAPFDAGEADASLERGVLRIVLPAKRPGEGKKLSVKEISDETPRDQAGK